RAETGHIRSPNSAPSVCPAGGRVSTDSAGGACCRITCALVPLIPNEDTAAVRGWSLTGHGTGSGSRRTVPADQSTCGLGRSTFRVGGNLSWLRAAIILIIPATPAAAWVWPMLDLIDPSHSGCSASRA